MNKVLTIILIILLSIITLGMIFGLYFLVKTDYKFDNFTFSFSSLSKKLIDEKEIKNIKDLDIKSDAADVIIEEKDITTIKVELYSDNPKYYEITENEDKIIVALETKNVIGFAFHKSPNIKIYVPRDYNKNIKVDAHAGDIKIGYLSNASLNATLDAGDIKVKELNSASIKAKVGDIKIDKIETLNSDVTTGDTKIEYVSKLVSKNTTGDVKINNVNGFVDIIVSTGDIKIENAFINNNSKIKNNIGDVKIYNITGCYVNGKTNVGDTRINNKDRKSDIELIIENNIGDVKVN